MGRTACTQPQCLYSTAVPLLPIRAVLPVQSLSACTGVTFAFTYNQTEEIKIFNAFHFPKNFLFLCNIRSFIFSGQVKEFFVLQQTSQ